MLHAWTSSEHNAMSQSVAVSTSLFVLSASAMMLLMSYRRSMMSARPLLQKSAATAQSFTSSSQPAGNHAAAMKPPREPSSSSKNVSSLSEETELGGCDACNEKPNDMLGTVKAYDRHVIICVPPHSSEIWERDIDMQADTFPYSLIKHIEDIKKANKIKAESSTEPVKALKLKLTALVEAGEDIAHPMSSANVLVYPDNLLFSVHDDQLAQFAAFLSQPLPLREAPDFKQYICSAPAWKKLVLVCQHGARDKRCGRAGPQVIAELQRLLGERAELEAQSGSSSGSSSTAVATAGCGPAVRSPVRAADVAVRGSSHIGGHVYAGTMIVYPEGEWYGRVTKHNSAALLDHIQAGAVYSQCLRGNTSSKVLQW